MARLLLSLVFLLALVSAACSTPVSVTTSTSVDVSTSTSVGKGSSPSTPSTPAPALAPALAPAGTPLSTAAGVTLVRLSRRTVTSSKGAKGSTLSFFATHLSLGQLSLAVSLTSRLRAQVQKTSPAFATQHWINSNAERYFVSLLLSGRQLTILLPTDRALRRWSKRSTTVRACLKSKTERNLDDVLARHMLTQLLTARTLRRLTTGTKLATMAPVFLTVKKAKKPLQLGITSGSKFLSYASATSASVSQTGRGYSIIYLDNILTTC